MPDPREEGHMSATLWGTCDACHERVQIQLPEEADMLHIDCSCENPGTIHIADEDWPKFSKVEFE